MIPALLLGAIPGVLWVHGLEHAPRLKQAGIEPARASDIGERVRLLAPGLTGDLQSASATRDPWVVANGWQFQRRPARKYLYDLPAGVAALAAAEAFAYGVDALLEIRPVDIEATGRMLAFLRTLDADPGPALAQVGVVDDGSVLAGDVMNLLSRTNLPWRAVSGPDPKLAVTIRLGSSAHPRGEAADPHGFTLKIRRQIGDQNRLLRVYGSEMALCRLAGDDSRLRLHVLNYSGGQLDGLRIRLRGGYAAVAARGSGLDRLTLDDFRAAGEATEFTIPTMEVYAVIDLRRVSTEPRP